MEDNINNMPVLLRGNGDFTEEQFEEVMRADNQQHLMLSLGLTTGTGCNMRCIYCYTEGGYKEAGHTVKGRMTPADYEKAIRQSAALGAQSVIIVGVGETMLDKNLPQVIEMTSRAGMYPLIFTNGTRLDRETARFLFENHTTIYLSLDSTVRMPSNALPPRKGCSAVSWRHRPLPGGGVRQGKHAKRPSGDRLRPEYHGDEGECWTYRGNRAILPGPQHPVHLPLPREAGIAPEFWREYIAADAAEEEKLRSIASRYSRGGEVFSTEYGCLFWW